MPATRTYLCMTSPTSSTRTGTPGDKVVIERSDDRALLQALYEPLAQEFRWPAHEAWAQGFDLEGRVHYVVRVGTSPAGLGKLIWSASDSLQLSNFGLLEAYRGRGAGKAALDLLLEAGWELLGGSGKIWLHTSSEDHPHALGNYLSRGFNVVSPEDVA